MTAAAVTIVDSVAIVILGLFSIFESCTAEVDIVVTTLLGAVVVVAIMNMFPFDCLCKNGVRKLEYQVQIFGEGRLSY